MVLRVLMTRRWLGALALAVTFAVACVFLGRWQWHRYEFKHERAQRVTSHYHADPVPLPSVLATPDTPLRPAQVWTPVTVTGIYRAQDLLLVRNRPNNGIFGYEVLVPLRTPGGGAVLVDRGWVDNGRTASTRPQVPPTPQGQVTVTGWLRAGEPSLGRQLVPGQLASINIAQAQAQTGGNLYDTYLIAKGEHARSGRPVTAATPLAAPDTDEGPHLAYALQWWGATLVGFVLVFVGVRREAEDEEDARADLLEAEGAPSRPPRPPRPRRTRIWDEEDA